MFIESEILKALVSLVVHLYNNWELESKMPINCNANFAKSKFAIFNVYSFCVFDDKKKIDKHTIGYAMHGLYEVKYSRY